MNQQGRDDEHEALIREVRMTLSSVASHGPAALTSTHDPMYTANLLLRLSNALEAARKHPEPEPPRALLALIAEHERRERHNESVPINRLSQILMEPTSADYRAALAKWVPVGEGEL